jgi:hypothetical protein
MAFPTENLIDFQVVIPISADYQRGIADIRWAVNIAIFLKIREFGLYSLRRIKR